MDITTLANLLHTTYEHSGNLVIPATNLLQSPAISTLLTDYLNSQLEIDTIQRSQTDTTVVYTGQMHLFNQSYAATATFYLLNAATNGTPELTLSVPLPANWTFSSTFPPLASQIIAIPTFLAPTFVLSSAPSDGTGTFIGIQQGFNFSGTLQIPANSIFTPISWLLGSNLLLTGLLSNLSDPLHTAPTLTLTTPLLTSTHQLGSVSLFTQIQLSSTYTSTSSSISSVQLPPPAHDLLQPGIMFAVTSPLTSPSADTTAMAPVLHTSVTLIATLTFGSQPGESLTLSLPLSTAPGPLVLQTTTSTTLPSLQDLANLVGGTSLSNLIPSQYPLSSQFVLQSFMLAIDPKARTFTSLAMQIALEQPASNPPNTLVSPTWVIIPALVTLNNINLVFALSDPLHPVRKNLQASINASLAILNALPLNVVIMLPDPTIHASLPKGQVVAVDSLLQQFVGAGLTLPQINLNVSTLNMLVKPGTQTYSLQAGITGNWPLIQLGTAVDLVLTGMMLDIERTQTSLTATISGSLTFDSINFVVSAQKTAAAADSTWIFMGKITSPFSISTLITDLTDLTPPSFLSNMQVKTLSAMYTTRATGAGDFALAGSLLWPFTLGGTTFTLNLAFMLMASHDAQNARIYSGSLMGEFDFLGLQPIFTYTFNQANKNTTYTLQLDPFTVQFVNTPADQKLAISFGDTTVGNLLEWLIKLADPAASNQLMAPWNVLNSISLQGLVVTLDFTHHSVEVDYPVNTDLGFIQIQSFAITYTRDAGQSTIQIKLGGDFLGQTYDKDTNPLTWDALNGQPPSAPGLGDKLLDLKYVGLGQHVALADIQDLTTMSQVIKALQDTLVPLSDLSQNPLQQVGGLQFSSASSWLIGADFVFLRTFALSLIFNDPQLYGMLISVDGPEAAIFQGLRFEILYRKITDKIGLFHIELQLPDEIRHLEFGAVSVTLPILDLDIYTNGNFRVDLGFPTSLQDFSRSFNIQVFPFVGYGGFYFALLSGDTATNIPVISNGNFNPVIEFGFALSVGVGKTITLGPLSAGVSVTVLGSLQGAFAWFNPNDSSPTALYYKLQGTISIVGKIYGTIDFVVVKASLSLTVFASVTLTVESYQPILIAISAGVTVEVGLQILFITVHFRFSATVNLNFTIGSASTPPWLTVPNPPAPMQLRSQATLYNLNPTHLALTNTPAFHGLQFPHSHTFNMVGRAINDADTTPLTVYAAPAFSQALPLDLAIPPALPPAGTTPVAAANLLLFIENAASPTANSASTASIPSATAATAPFNVLLTKLLRWTIAALETSGSSVTAAELAAIHTQLDDPAQAAQIFSYQNLTLFFTSSNVTFQLAPRPTLSTNQLSGTFFPIFPELLMTDGAGTSVAFSSVHSVSQTYLQNLNTYFSQLMVEYENSVEQDPAGTGNTPPNKTINAASLTSIATFVFCSYFEMLTKSVVQSAQDLLQSYPYPLTQNPGYSLQQIADSFQMVSASYRVRRADTHASIAARIGHTEQTIRLLATAPLQPGAILAIPVGVTVTSIVIANQAQTDILNTSTSLSISGVVYQIKHGDTLNSIAALFALSELALLTANTSIVDLLLAGSTLSLGTLQYTGQSSDTLTSVALYFAVPVAQVSQSGNQYTISAVTHTLGQSFLIPYTTHNGDTLDSLITTFLAPPANQFANYRTLLQSQNPNVDFTHLAVATLVNIPATETLSNLARYYYPDLTPAQQLQQLSSVIQATPLTPLLSLVIPPITYAIQPTDTLASIAQQFNLTLEQLSTSIAATPDIFVASTILTIPDVPVVTVDALCTALKQSPLLNTASSMTSRFLLQGLRLPYPQSASDMNTPWTPQTPLTTYPLYALTGQEYQLPTPLPANYTLTLTQNPPVSWLQFATTGPLTLPLQPQEIQQITDFSTLQFTPELSLLTRLPLYTYTPQRFALQQMQHWQAADLQSNVQLVNPGQKAGEPTLWPFPSTLLAQLAATASAGNPLYYNVATSTYLDSSSGIQINPVQHYQWATSVSIAIQEIPSADFTATPLPNTYLLVGADDQGKQTLLALLNYLNAPNSQSTATVFLLYQPDPSGNNPNGLASDALAMTQTYLLQTNLSTVGTSGAVAPSLRLPEPAPAATPAMPTPLNSAPLSNATQFLQLLWEGSVVKSGGYYLHYVNTNEQTGLPGYIFSQQQSATITLVVLLTNQHQILPFNNAVAIGDMIDASRSQVFVEPLTYVVEPSDTLGSIQALLYNMGVTAIMLVTANATILNLLLPGATLQLPTSPATTYAVKYGDTFSTIATASGVTLASLATANLTSMILRPGALLQYVPGQLQMHATVPPGNTGVHLQRANPLASASSQDTQQIQDQQALNNLFSLLGTSIAANANFLASWEGIPAGPSSSAQESSDGIRPGSPSVQNMSDLWDYKPIISIYQAAQAAFNPALNSLALPPQASYPYAGIAATAQILLDLNFHDPYGNRTTATSNIPFNTLQIPVGYTDALLSLSQWPSLGYSYQFPAGSPALAITSTFSPVRYLPTSSNPYANAHNSARADFVQYQNIFYQLQQRDLLQFMLQTSVGTLQLTQSIQQSLQLTIRNQVCEVYQFLHIASNLTPSYPALPAGQTLQTVATTYAVQVVDLLTTNKDVILLNQWFAPATTILIPAYYVFKAGDTLTSIAQQDTTAFLNCSTPPISSQLTCLIAQMVVNDATLPLKPGTSLNLQPLQPPTSGFTQYIIQAGDTLQSIATSSSLSASTLLTNNVTTPDLFPAGTSLYLGMTTSYTLSSTDTFSTLASMFNITLAELATYNGPLSLLAQNQSPTTQYLAIPYLLEFPASPSSFYTSYRADGTETLASIVALYPGWSLPAFLTLNNDIPGLFATTPLPYGDNYTPLLTDTINTLAQHFNQSPLTFVTAIASLAHIIRSDALFFTPPLQTTATLNTPFALAQTYHFTSAEALAQANASLHTILQPQQQINYVDPFTSRSVTYKTGNNDTFASIVAHLNALLQTTTATISTMLVQNPQLVFQPGSFLLPPPRLASASFAVTLPTNYPQPIFPLTVTLTINRDQLLVDPDFATDTSVFTTSTDLVALPLLNDSYAPAALTGFAANFEQAFTGLKLATSSQQANASTAPDHNPSHQRLWVVNFSATTGGFQYQVQSDLVRFFAIKPLTTSLWNATAVPIQTYTSGQSALTTTMQNFQSANPDLWLSLLLSAVDTILSPAYAVPVFQLDPAQFQSIMDCKNTLAMMLQALVADLLTPVPHPENLLPLQAAQDALYQQALISLADVYTTTVLLQFPFMIQAPSTSLQLAPRLSGKPTARVYTTGLNDSLPALVTYFGVGRVKLVSFLQSQQLLLNTQAIVALSTSGSTFPITKMTTFATLAAFFDVDLATLAQQLIVTNNQPLFLPNVVINATNVTHQLLTGDTFTSVANYFGIAPTDLAISNQDVPNIFLANSTVTLLQGQTPVQIPVVPNDTLNTITGKFNHTTTPTQAQLLIVATQLWQSDQTNASLPYYSFNPGTTLYDMQLIPTFNLTTATLPLAPAPSEVQSTFLLSLKDPDERKMLFLNLDYVLNELQYALQLPQSDNGYQESSWLSFILPLNASNEQALHSNASLGLTQIPIPLRTYPALATLTNQTANASFPTASDLSKAKEWDYAFTLNHQNAAQDSLELGLFFNWTSSTPPVPPQQPPLTSSDDALYAALAQFALAYPQLKQDLTHLLTDPGNSVVQPALTTFVTFLQAVCAVHAVTPARLLALALENETHWYELDTLVDQSKPDHYEYLVLKTPDTTPLWPQLGGQQPAFIIPGTASTPSQALYTYTQMISQPLAEAFAFPQLDSLQRQNGWSGISVSRNQHLITTSATNQPVNTNPDFVYTTPFTLFTNKAYPLLSITNLTPLHDPNQPANPVTALASALSTFFTQLFTPTPGALPAGTTPSGIYTIKLTARYIYTKVAATPSSPSSSTAVTLTSPNVLNTILPIVHVPLYNFNTATDIDPTNLTSFVSQLAIAIDQAATQLGIPAVARNYLFDLTVYSSLSTSSNLPLIQITNLLYQP